jgi:hypothetical protein
MAGVIPFSLIEAATVYVLPSWVPEAIQSSDPMTKRRRGGGGGGNWGSGY